MLGSSRLTRILLASSLLLSVPAQSAPSDPAYSETVFVDGPEGATAIGWAPDGSGRLFLALKTGQVRIVENGELRELPFSTDAVTTSSECGLLGLAFDPDYVSNRFVYLRLCASASEQQLVRYTDLESVGANRMVVVSRLPTRGAANNGGAFGFGPDGKLYWGIGDLGNASGVDADLVSMASKVSRGNRDGTPVSGNPFNDGVGPNNEYIWARGFRQPLRLAFHPVSGALWVNSVGDSYEQLFIVSRRSHAGYDDYENDQPSESDFVSPAVVYRKAGVDTWNLAAGGVLREDGLVTFTTTDAHGFRTGGRIVVAGVDDGSFNGPFTVLSTPSATSFTVQQPGTDATASGGTVSSLNLGGGISGGVFYDASLFGAGEGVSYFFSDSVSGSIHKVALGPEGKPADVALFATGLGDLVDLSVGPDGALYALEGTNGRITRIARTSALELVVSARNLRGLEGGRVAFSVSLGSAPAEETVVSVARSEGDAELVVEGPGELRFTADNWNLPQPVVIFAAEDEDETADSATFTLSAPGLPPQQVFASVLDEKTPTPVLSPSGLSVDEGSSGTFTMALAFRPSRNVVVTLGRMSGDERVSLSSAQHTFTPSNWGTPQTITVSASADEGVLDGEALVRVSATGGLSRDLLVSVRDTTPIAPVFLSPVPQGPVIAGVPWRYEASAGGRPAPFYSLRAAPQAAQVEPETGLLAWTPDEPGLFAFELLATNEGGEAEQVFSVTVLADAVPAVSIGQPQADAVLRGAGLEFHALATDDVGLVGAEFLVDGELASAVEGAGPRYDFEGAPDLFDVSSLEFGPHALGVRVFDTRGQSAEDEVRFCVEYCEAPGEPDAGTSDAGAFPDGGRPVAATAEGCGCSGAAASMPVWTLLLALLVRRRA